MLYRLTLIGACAALMFAATATASYKQFWHHTTETGIVCNDNAEAVGVPGEDGFTLVSNPADAGPFTTRADCLAYIAPASAAATPQPADSYLWCNSQTEASPFSLSLAESLTLTANWYRPLMVDGIPTCATTGLHPTGSYLDSNGNGPSNQAQYDADLAYWGVAFLYQTATR